MPPWRRPLLVALSASAVLAASPPVRAENCEDEHESCVESCGIDHGLARDRGVLARCIGACDTKRDDCLSLRVEERYNERRAEPVPEERRVPVRSADPDDVVSGTSVSGGGEEPEGGSRRGRPRFEDDEGAASSDVSSRPRRPRADDEDGSSERASTESTPRPRRSDNSYDDVDREPLPGPRPETARAAEPRTVTDAPAAATAASEADRAFDAPPPAAAQRATDLPAEPVLKDSSEHDDFDRGGE